MQLVSLNNGTKMLPKRQTLLSLVFACIILSKSLLIGKQCMLFIAMYFIQCTVNLKITYVFIPQADEKPLATPNSSDTGFDEPMDISDGKNSNT